MGLGGIEHPGEKKDGNGTAGRLAVPEPGPKRAAFPVDVANPVNATTGGVWTVSWIENLVLNAAAFQASFLDQGLVIQSWFDAKGPPHGNPGLNRYGPLQGRRQAQI